MSDVMTQEEAMNMSNEQAVQILVPMRNMMCDRYGCPISDAVFALDKAIEVLSADRPKGKWIRRGYWSEGIGMGESYDFYYECSNCGKQAQGDYHECGMNYCPNCGSQNQKVSE